MESFGDTSRDLDNSSKSNKFSEASITSWDTIDIEEERASNSRSNKFFLVGSIFLNIFLNLILLVLYFQIHS